MTYLSAPARKVFEAVWNTPVVAGDHEGTRRRQVATALRALTTTAAVRSAAFGDQITFAVAVEDLLTMATELEAVDE